MKVVATKTDSGFNEPLEPGDTFIYFSKYGGDPVFGEVKEINTMTCKTKTLNYIRTKVVSTKGNTYELGEVFKVTKVLTEEEKVVREKAIEDLKAMQEGMTIPTFKGIMELRKKEDKM